MNSEAIAAQAGGPLLDVRDLTVTVPARGGVATIVDGISFRVERGEALGVVGESGCGKSITAMSLLGLLPPGGKVSKGSAAFEGKDLFKLRDSAMRKVRGGRISVVFQDPMTSLNPVMRVGDQIAEPLMEHLGLSKADAWKRAGELLRLVGIPGGETRLTNYPHELSGGMRQRVMIAIGLACEPPLVIADEPTTALDVTIQAQIVDLVKDLRARLGMSIIWITHDLALVSGLVDRVMVLYSGKVVEEAPVDALYANPTHPYTRGLLASLPRLEGEESRRLPSIAGTPPDPRNRPAGCPFAPRCAMKIARCERDMPELEAVPGDAAGHRAACWVTVEGRTEAAA
ncbi:peptide ABC transporter ATP-binding protein [Youhaiella tibetensis]|uniref:ABC transporter ATP-binding protein n=1 Tax=Paradevosia tibetensis TaxID=1447062 RepID=A0A5B9DSN0_9HYPH|nr:ABC transporter ATP-binding protein [Youhaiella tibetensis]AKR57224.1 peptide ABC transporter ATP-binding protein [Devosia sp. H5989]QEE22166.1 ABC transporter ATP-binding protein [Youhaiella tibetensis]GGF44685.1 peptide ABC transporter ATP-binding protein [Youhaiella tibetensis]